jgi:cell division protein FtsB
MPGLSAVFSTLAFFLFLFIFLLFFWRDIMAQQKLLEKENVKLKVNYGKLSAKIA